MSTASGAQPIHDVGNDVRLLGLPDPPPRHPRRFRMLCRHNKYVQEFGQVRDADEIARRERLWENAIDEIEYETGRQVASMRAASSGGSSTSAATCASFRPALAALRRDRCRAGEPAGVCSVRGRRGSEPPDRRQEPTMTVDRGLLGPDPVRGARRSSPRSPAS